MSDAERIEAVLAGRREAFEGLVCGHLSRIRALCWSRLGPGGSVDDMVQETFLRAFRSLGRLENPERFASWLAGIAVRVCSDWRKAKARTEVSLEVDPAASGTDESDERRARLRERVDALPEIYRETLRLFYYEKRSYREIAERLSVGEAAVNARLTKARALLREQLEESE